MKSLLRVAGAAIGAVILAKFVADRVREARYVLQGRVVLITGGSRGLGLLLAREYASHGAKLVLLSRDSGTLEAACSELMESGAEVLGLSCDVTDEKQVGEAVARALLRFGRIDIVVNDAGRIEVGPLEAMTTSDFQAS